MQLFLLTALTMVAFAANSILNRAAVDGAGVDPLVFALIRVAGGVVMLWLLVFLRKGARVRLTRARVWGAATLALYMLGFSLAYLTLNAGLGALILFGGVQITMFAGAVIERQAIAPRRWAGALIAFAGLVYLLWPGADARVDTTGALLMAAAALGWGLYSLHGRGAADALGDTAGNFLLCLPVVAIGAIFASGYDISAAGLLLALASGAITSGMGYALWYRVLPRLDASTAAIAQLSVPVIAVAAGALLLGEAPTAKLVLSGAIVLGGIALATVRRSG